MIQHNWLVSYATTEGIGKILTQMDHRTKNKSGMRTSIDELLEFYDEYDGEFTAFFEEMRTYVKEKIVELEGQTA